MVPSYPWKKQKPPSVSEPQVRPKAWPVPASPQDMGLSKASFPLAGVNRILSWCQPCSKVPRWGVSAWVGGGVTWAQTQRVPWGTPLPLPEHQ